MQFLYWLSKEVVIGVVITLCSIFSVFGQASQPNIVDTAARPKVFAEGAVSSPYSEWATSFAPDGNTVYFSRGAIYWTICYSKLVDGKWGRPVVAAFSGKYNDTDPFVSPDGKRMFFISNRPYRAGEEKPQKNYHIWYVDHVSGDEWSAPKHADAPVSLEGSNNYAPSVSSTGTLFFCSRGREGNAGMASYSARWLGDHYDKPQKLALLGKEDMQDPFIAPDESYMVFLSGNDLYYCSKNGSGWGVSQKLGPQVNNGDGNSSPYVSRDGKTLYYSSSRVQGFYKRNIKSKPLNYDELEAENKSIFNSEGNILMIPVNIPKASN
jgi:Tol biopolymer transport system component